MRSIASTIKPAYDLIVCSSLNRGIGYQGKLLWYIPEELKMFKKITCSGPATNSMIMGRKTFDSIGKVLPNRLSIVISKESKIEESQNLRRAKNFEEALKITETLQPEGKIFVIGGYQVFKDSLPGCRYIYETCIHENPQADAFMPEHNYPCAYTSRIQKFSATESSTSKKVELKYEYKLFYNNKFFLPPSANDNLFHD